MKNTTKKRWLIAAAAIVLLLAWLPSAEAALLQVADCGDDGSPGQLRDLVNKAVTGDTVDASFCALITLKGASGDDSNKSGDIDIGVAKQGLQLVIQGAGMDQTVITAESDRIFKIDHQAASVTIRDLTIKGGNPGNNSGGGIWNSMKLGSLLLLERVRIEDNTAPLGGGIGSMGSVTIVQSIIAKNRSVSPNENEGGGGIAFLGESILLKLDQTTVSDNTSASYGGGVFVPPSYEGVKIELLNNTVFKSNIAEKNGGAIAFLSSRASTSLTLTNSLIEGNTSLKESGGGILSFAQQKLTIAGSTIAKNIAGNEGGGLYTSTPTTEIKNSLIEANEAKGTGSNYGGGLNVTSSTLTIADSIVKGNIAEYQGGGLSTRGTSIVLTNTIIDGNKALKGNGGGISTAEGGGLGVKGGAIKNNSALLTGGGVNISNASSDVTLDGTEVSGNTAGKDGGGLSLLLHAKNFVVKGTTFSNNSADSDADGSGDGGAIAFVGLGNPPYSGKVSLSSSRFVGNSAVEGGGFIINNAQFEARGTEISKGKKGGGIALYDVTPATLDTMVIAENAGPKAGILLYSSSDDQKIATIANSVIRDNGPGIWHNSKNGELTLANVIVANNKACQGCPDSGGVNLSAGQAKVNNATVVNNQSGQNGLQSAGGILASPGSTFSLKNSVILGNTDGNGETSDYCGTLTSLDYNVVGVPKYCTLGAQSQPWCPLQGTVAHNLRDIQDPKLDPATFAPLLGSPLVDKGSPSAPGSGGDSCEAADAAGIARPVDGDGDGNALCDVGAVEFSSSIIQLSASTYAAGEGDGKITIRATRTGGSQGQVTADYATSAVTATAGKDYQDAKSPPPLAWPDGVTGEQSFTVDIIQDNDLDPGETFQAALFNLTGKALMGARDTATVTINDDDSPGKLEFASATFSAKEGAGKGTITVNRTGGSNGKVSVDYKTLDGGTATKDTDYKPIISGTLTWEAGDATPKSFEVILIDDAALEADETVKLFLENYTGGAAPGLANAILTIVNDDLPGNLEFSSDTFTVSEGAGEAKITVVRSGGKSGEVGVEYTTLAGTAKEGVDFKDAFGTFAWKDGDDTPRSFSVPIIDEKNKNGDEEVGLRVINPSGGAKLGGRLSAVLTILENDSEGELQFSAPSMTVFEDVGKAKVTVTRTNGVFGAVSVEYATDAMKSTAKPKEDYLEVKGPLNWANDDGAPKSFEVPVVAGDAVRGERQVILSLSNAGGGAKMGADSMMLLTIKDVICGNGALEGNEECDDGNKIDTDACLLDCRKATCGDGILWQGVEQCDGGANCTATCTLKPAVPGAEQPAPPGPTPSSPGSEEQAPSPGGEGQPGEIPLAPAAGSGGGGCSLVVRR